MQPNYDPAVHLVAAANLLHAGQDEQQAAASLRARFGYLSEDQAAMYVEQAYHGVLAAGGLAASPSNQRLAALTGDATGADRQVTVEVLYSIDWPGHDRENRTMRFRGRSTDEFAGEIMAAIQDQIDQWAEQYSEDGASYGYEIRLIF